MQIFQRIDDVEYAHDKSEIIAAHTVKVTWQVDGGPVESATVDLSAKNLETYGAPVRELIHAYEVNNPERKPARAVGGAMTPVGTARKYGQAVRKFTDDYGIKRLDGDTRPDGTVRPAYETPKGGWYPPRWLVKAYDHFVLTGEVVLPRKTGGADE